MGILLTPATRSEVMGKTRANRRLYIEILKGMTPEQRLRKSFELTAMARQVLRAGLKHRNPELTTLDLDTLVRERVLHWHNRNS
jgi:hypothetical protein